ncbi:MAG: hypothetical protein HZA29_04630 [Candidatus Omnitrophica bacterium]|nr:hypothetical protein [Candidatus Omnitrophota bacterium]
MGRTDVPGYSLDQEGNFRIDNYNLAKPFSNFFPGIAGTWGTPMWVFYVNRGQAITSFGVESKDKAIVEFQPANKACRLTALQGFRTFVKVRRGSKTVYWEPFQNHLPGTEFKKRQRMSISPHDLTLIETNLDLGLEARVNYFTMPEEPYSALVRRVTVINKCKKSCSVEMVDGLPLIVPYGMKDWVLKNMSRTGEAWVHVGNVRQKAPYYNLTVEISDTPQVTRIDEGNFFFSFDLEDQSAGLLDPIVEASRVFGATLDFLAPQQFMAGNLAKGSSQQTSNRMPSVLSHSRFILKAGGEREIVSLFGYVPDVGGLNQIVRQVMGKDGFVAQKASRNQEIIDGIRGYALTRSSSKSFDLYTGQTFLDNILRGGLPVSVKTADGPGVFNMYSRKHGDPERDYNYFVVAPTFYSQGNGNYRDVNQNRRNDAWFNMDVRDSHVVSFLNLVQADGYNPLIVKGTVFHLANTEKLGELLDRCVLPQSRAALKEFLHKSFAPGDLFRFIDSRKIKLAVEPRVFLDRVLELCRRQETADHGEGFWSDHWTYNLDLIESYLALYPEDLRGVLLGCKTFSFYRNTHYVLPRAQRYILTDKGVRQYHSVAKEVHQDKPLKGHFLREGQGEGDIYHTTLFVKVLCLIANKIATLDPGGTGVEMEADKPDWYDALNGLPGLLGSSVSETFEIQRTCRFLLEAIAELELKGEATILVFEELADFIVGLKSVLAAAEDPLEYWLKSNDLKEEYRRKIIDGIDGKEKGFSVNEIREFLALALARAQKAAASAKDARGRLATYFYHEVTEYKRQPDGKHVWPLKFRRHALPAFLEGYVHALRTVEDAAAARKLYQQVRNSGLFDKPLKMYKVNADLSGESEEIGRARIFPPGWLENESIWLHMEYKFLLELLRAGLHEEFFENFRNVLIPFLKPGRYGRSILENSSFLVSSAHEDKSLHGRGFVARLSGSTSEFLHMWLLMNVGPRPFFVEPNGLAPVAPDFSGFRPLGGIPPVPPCGGTGCGIKEGELCLQFKPALPGWLFTRRPTVLEYINQSSQKMTVRLPAHVYAFLFLGSTLVVYHNPKRRDTYKASIKEIHLTYPHSPQPVVLASSFIPPPHSQEIRKNKVQRVDIYFQ